MLWHLRSKRILAIEYTYDTGWYGTGKGVRTVRIKHREMKGVLYFFENEVDELEGSSSGGKKVIRRYSGIAQILRYGLTGS